MARRGSVGAVPGYQLVQVTDLGGGVDLRRDLSQLSPQRSRRLSNWDISEPGALRVYPGWQAFSTTSLGSDRIQGAARIAIKRGGSNLFTLAAYGGSVYKPSDAGVWGSTVLTGLDNGNVIWFTHDRDVVAVFDGTNVPKQSTNGTDWYQFGVTAPSSPATLAGAAGGSLIDTNQYEVSYTYRDATYLVESNGATVATHTAATPNLKITCTLARSTDAQVDTICVYARNVTAGETVRRRVGTVANPGAGNATYTIESDSWTSGVEEPTTHNVWTSTKFGCVWKNRWWGVDATTGNRLKFSEIFVPQAAPTLYYIDLPFEQGDDIQGMAPMGDTLVVWGSRRTYLVIGQTSLDFEVRPSLGSLAGVLGPRAWAQVETGLVHAASDGIYLFDGATDKLLTQDIETAWQDYVDNTSSANLYRTPVIYHLKRKEIRVGVTRCYPTTTAGEWILNLTRSTRTEAWMSTTRTVGGYVVWEGPETVQGNYGRIFTWGLTVGKLYEECTGTSADGSDIVAVYEGPGLTTGLHAARFIDFYGEYKPAAGSLGCEIEIDEAPVATLTLDIGQAGSVYNSAVYGTGTYAVAPRQKWERMLPLGAEGRTVTVTLQYTGQGSPVIFNYALGVVTEPAPRGM